MMTDTPDSNGRKQPQLVPASKRLQPKVKPPAPETVVGQKRAWLHKPGRGYQLLIEDLGVQIDATRVRNARDELSGLLTVRARFAGARTVFDHILSSADFNFASLRARSERAKHLDQRARAPEIDWLGILEEFCLRVLAEEETGVPEIALADIPVPTKEYTAEFEAGTMPLLRRHPTIWFGDGSAGKSLLALYAAIDLAQNGQRVLYCDWELAGDEHAERLQRFVGPVPGMKDSLFYRRCDRPFIRDVEQIRDVVSKRSITFIVCDSIGFACDGPPESAEAATGYFRALRELGAIGSLHLAHMNRSEQGDQKPFGSIFWHAGARATWHLRRSKASHDNSMIVGLWHRKSNLGKLRPAFARRVDFEKHTTRVVFHDIKLVPEFNDKLEIADRIEAALDLNGPMTAGQLADELGVKKDSLRKTLLRNSETFERTSIDGVEQIRLVKTE